MKNNVFYFLIIVFCISFFLPAQSAGIRLIKGHEAAWFVFGGWLNIIDGIKINNFFEGLFLNLPNLLIVITIAFNNSLKKYLKIIFLILVLFSTLYWFFTFLYRESLQELQIGYYLWLISSIGIMIFSLRKRSNQNNLDDILDNPTS